jgi:hypothetical protein
MRLFLVPALLAGIAASACRVSSGASDASEAAADTVTADARADAASDTATDTSGTPEANPADATDAALDLAADMAGDVPADATSDASATPDAPDVQPDPGSQDSALPDAPVDTVEPPGICPVTGYEPCGGDLLGTWKFLAMCPDDPDAANDLCETPLDTLPQCIGGGNQALCHPVIDGTMTFVDAETVHLKSEHWIEYTWVFTDACLAAAGLPGADATERCLSQDSDKLSCSYEPDACTCKGASWKEPDDSEAPYSAAGSEMTLFADKLQASFCIVDDVLTIDHYQFHPVSWRYWVLQKVEDSTPEPLSLDQAQAMLPGVWEGVAFADSGMPVQEVPPGTYNVFLDDGTFSFKCAQPSSMKWTLVEKWGFPTVEVTLAPGSVVYWVIQELTDAKLTYIEGGDTFYYERRADCAP